MRLSGSGLRLGRLVYGLGRARGAGGDGRRRPRLRAGPGRVGAWIASSALLSIHATYRRTARAGASTGLPRPSRWTQESYCRSCSGWTRSPTTASLSGAPGAVAGAGTIGCACQHHPRGFRQLLWHQRGPLEGLGSAVQRHPDIPASTNRLEGWLGRLEPRARHFVGLMAGGMA